MNYEQMKGRHRFSSSVNGKVSDVVENWLKNSINTIFWVMTKKGLQNCEG